MRRPLREKLCAQSLAHSERDARNSCALLSLSACSHARDLQRMEDLSQLAYLFAAPLSVRDAVRRRFLGVVGVGRQDMLAKVQVDLGPPLLLNLVLDKAKLAPNSTDATRPDLNGVSPIVSAVLGPAPNQVIISNISQEQLVAINLQAPVVADGVFTDRVINICIDDSTVPVRARVLQCLADPVSGRTIYFLRTGINNIITKSQGEVELAIDGRPPPGNDENTTTGNDTAGNDSNGPWHPPGGSTGDARNLPPRAQFSPLATFQNLKFLLPESFPAANFANLQKLEELAQVLCTEVSGQLPVDAVTPRESADEGGQLTAVHLV